MKKSKFLSNQKLIPHLGYNESHNKYFYTRLWENNQKLSFFYYKKYFELIKTNYPKLRWESKIENLEGTYFIIVDLYNKNKKVYQIRETVRGYCYDKEGKYRYIDIDIMDIDESHISLRLQIWNEIINTIIIKTIAFYTGIGYNIWKEA